MRFQTSLLAGLLVVVVAVIASIVVSISIVVDRSARHRIEDDTARGVRVFADAIADRGALLGTQARVVAESPGIKAALASDVDPATLADVLSDLSAVGGAGLVLATDGDGKLLADAADPGAPQVDLAADPLIADALADGEAAGAWVRGGRLYQVHIAELEYSGHRVGLVVIGAAIDDAFAVLVHDRVGAGIAVVLDGHVVAASPLESGERIDPARFAAAIKDRTGTTEVAVSGISQLVRIAPHPAPAPGHALTFAVLRDLDRALAPGRQLQRLVWGTAAAAFALAVVLGIFLSRRIARPLEALVDLTRQVAAGDLAARVRPGGPVEARALAGSMNEMVETLAASRVTLAQKERLEGELEIAQRIQTSILPQRLAPPGADVAAVMAPADEVGGDYYDVIPCADGAWIAIGDVAGHGLPAGLVMMMIQSGVATALAQAPAARPGDVLRAVNAMAFDNVHRRMGQREHATLMLARYHATGRLEYAGAHQDMIRYRPGTACELVPTPGTWIGMIPDVTDHVPESTLELAAGDVLVLYTDGLTEAESATGEQFGLDRLCAAVAACGAEPVETICTRLLDAVRAWAPAPADDLTVLVLRHRGSAGRAEPAA